MLVEDEHGTAFKFSDVMPDTLGHSDSIGNLAVSFVSVLCQEAQCRFRWRHPTSVWDAIFLLKLFFTHDSRYAPWPSPRLGVSTALLFGDQ